MLREEIRERELLQYCNPRKVIRTDVFDVKNGKFVYTKNVSFSTFLQPKSKRLSNLSL